MHELSSVSSCSREKPSREDSTAEIQKHEFQADSDRRSIQELSGIIESQRRELDHAHQGDEQLRRDQLLHEQLSEQNRGREAHMKSLHKIEELKLFQGSTFDEFSRRAKIGNRDTIPRNSGPEFRNYKMKLIA